MTRRLIVRIGWRLSLASFAATQRLAASLVAGQGVVVQLPTRRLTRAVEGIVSTIAEPKIPQLHPFHFSP